MSYLTIQDVREFLLDESPDDNDVEMDLFFSDKQILSAMKRTAAEYQSMIPTGIDTGVTAATLPGGDTSIFLLGVASYLYQSAMHKIARNTLAWQTGDTSVDLNKTRFEMFKLLQQEYDQQWKQQARLRKANINRNQAYAYI